MRRLGPRVRVGMLVGLAVLWTVLLRPTNLGGLTTYLVVRGSSMLPTFSNGDLVILEPAARYGVGDVVAYRVPAGEIGAGHIVIHRIIGGDGSDGFILEGDNNTSADPWSPKASDVVGSPRWLIPGVGRALFFLHQPVVIAALAAAAVVGFIVAGAGSLPRRRPQADMGPERVAVA